MTLTTQSPTSGELGSAQPVTTLLGKGSEFEGKLSFEGTVRVDGKLTGEIFTDDVLIVGEGAEVNAEVTVGAIVIQGVVRGNITAKRSVEIHSPGKVKGNINTPSLFIEKGVFFDGHCQMDSGVAAAESSHVPRHSGGKKVSEKAPGGSTGASGGSGNSTT
ncbi:MAG: polymer-forming cytoskeletal protein [Deltaproteobacteria bacterium]|jgi:cytoskeletal protein CcmA (bactofilin family)|nr:polymer-forming cytoskeletal protein [Deltaproteobacteria bacterium]